jgi:hypothetical protein
MGENFIIRCGLFPEKDTAMALAGQEPSWIIHETSKNDDYGI